MQALLKYKRHIPFLLALAIISLFWTRETTPERPQAGLWVPLDAPRPVPMESFLKPGGERGTLGEHKGKVVLLNIWATWCTPCIKELPTLVALQKQKGDDLVVLTLSIDEAPFAMIEGFLQDKLNIALPHLAQDDTGKLFMQVGMRGLPLTYLIDREGHMTQRFIGGADWTKEWVQEPIDAALAR
jgi:thiol-disulfide isomerase/thioredoxin